MHHDRRDHARPHGDRTHQSACLHLDGFSALALRDLIGQASERGETTLRFKLSSQEAYEEALAFVSSQEVFRCFDGHVDGVTIANQDELRIIAIDWAPEELG